MGRRSRDCERDINPPNVFDEKGGRGERKGKEARKKEIGIGEGEDWELGEERESGE